MDIEEEDFRSLIDSNKLETEEDISDFEDFENYYGLGDDVDDDGEIKELFF